MSSEGEMGHGIDRELVRQLPKTDLHVHLDGSIRPATLIELAKEAGVDLPSFTTEGLMEKVFREKYESLDEYLAGFAHTCSVLTTPENLERVAYELARDNQSEGVRYVEVRFAPQLHQTSQMDCLDVIEAVDRGMSRAKRDFNSRREVADGSEPGFEYGLIACAMRYFDERFSPFFRRFMSVHRFTEPSRVYGLASIELVGAAVRARDERALPVVGVDLAGSEAGYPASYHAEAYQLAQRFFLKKTVHAGEAFGPESIYQAITELNADRIGHGTSLFNVSAVSDPTILDPEGYVESLVEYVADRRITIEVCLTSNMQTTPSLEEMALHPFGEMMDHRISVAICTDNRTVSRTTVTGELLEAVRTFGLNHQQLKDIVVYGFKRSFFPGSYREKRDYVRACMEHFERVISSGRGDSFPDGRKQ